MKAAHNILSGSLRAMCMIEAVSVACSGGIIVFFRYPKCVGRTLPGCNALLFHA